MSSKRRNLITEFAKQGATVDSNTAIDMLKKFHKENGAKFNESIDISAVLGIDARKMNVRGSIVLPHSIGKEINICCYTDECAPEELISSGATAAGTEDMINAIVAGEVKCDVLLTLKKDMPKLGKFGRQLGGKGLMPNPKDGTIADDIADLKTKIAESAKGKIKFRNEKGGIVHAAIGKVDLDNKNIVSNATALISAIKKLKPSKAKGKYLKKIYLSSSMGPSVKLDTSEFD
jgi:large subunit ribosomal protein L1